MFSLNRTDYLMKGFRQGLLAAAVLATGGIFAGSADASGWKDVGASERIDSAGRLNMLSQRIAASTCNLEAGVETVISRGILAGSRDEVERIINAIEFGNPRMKIVGAEKRPATLRYIRQYRRIWDETHNVISTIYDSNGGQAEFEWIERKNLDLFSTATYLTSEIAGQYSNPAELVQADAIVLDIVGRQRTRTQQLLKEACEVWQPQPQVEAVDKLNKTINLYEVSLNALIDGLPNAGVGPAPTPEIQSMLEDQRQSWSEIRPMLETLTSGGSLSDDEKTDLYLKLNDALIQTNLTMSLYTKYSKRVF